MSSFLSRLLGGFSGYDDEDRAATIMGSQGFPGGTNIYVPTWETNQAKWPLRSSVMYNDAGYINNSLIFRCVQFSSQGLGAAKLKVYRSAEENARSGEVADHPFRKLMRLPNLGQSEQTFLTFIGLQMAVTGFTVIEKERNVLGEVIGLWPLRCDWLKPYPRANALPDWEYTIPGQRPKIISSADVIPITYSDTIDNSPTGLGPLETCLRNLGISNALTDFIKVFMDRGAMPMYMAIPSEDPYIMAQWNDQAKVDTFRNKFSDTYGGLNKAVGVTIAPGIKTIERMGFGMDELAFPDLGALNDTAICQSFGISPIVLNTPSGLEQSSYNNYKEARRSFYEDTLFPIWGRIDDAFTRHLFSEMDDIDTYSLGFDTSKIPALKDDVSLAWERATDAFNVGRVSMNAALKHSGLDEVPEGDVYFIPDGVSVIEVGDLKTGAVQEAEAKGDIVSATGIAKVTQKAPHAEKINRGVDSRSITSPDGRVWQWDEDESGNGEWIEVASSDNEAEPE